MKAKVGRQVHRPLPSHVVDNSHNVVRKNYCLKLSTTQTVLRSPWHPYSCQSSILQFQ